MKKYKQEMVGSFQVISEDQQVRRVVVSQDQVGYYKGNINHGKSLHLETLNGLEVYRTNDPFIFRLSDGTTLRRITSNR